MFRGRRCILLRTCRSRTVRRNMSAADAFHAATAAAPFLRRYRQRQ